MRSLFMPQHVTVLSESSPLGLGFRIDGLGVRVEGLGFRVPVSGFRVQGLGLI